nr:uncharacterized protein LOC111421327 [Onthophagus taurus]
MEEANDLLKNGILIETSKGLVCMSVTDALSSNLNLSVEELHSVATQLLSQQQNKEVVADSDGFTSESSIDVINIQSIQEPISFDLVKPESIDVKSNVKFEVEKPPVKKRGGWPKGRKRKPELLHLPPKAPATGYNLFLNDQRKLLKDINLPFHEKTKLIGNKWSSLTLEEKTPYLEKAEEEKRRYREEFREYRQSGAYQLYLANKRKKRAKYNVLSESDMDATDDIDDEDNEELYCRTCDQWFHNLHNKSEHLLSRQHQQSIAGAISRELNSDQETDVAGTSSCLSFSTSLDESSLDGMPLNNCGGQKQQNEPISDAMTNLICAVSRREAEIKALKSKLEETLQKNGTLLQQYRSLKEIECGVKKHLALLKEQEKDMELNVFRLWQVPSWFIVTDLNQSNEEYNLE